MIFSNFIQRRELEYPQKQQILEGKIDLKSLENETKTSKI